ncbi:succinyl-diaminopimelate desuccinylase [Palleronia sp. LCG004]|uniref:succinyl-diaminopimelate desuccinylase n=1 Tax=Palleronia sp. LCG004 TaxID=3079304 RepID=UPI002942BB6E|nr:succinyl-diaminopimelate desuccinylase [Palleronia sp. LCG004]WOI55576.1 succinyl-diaminopimelate desuccinylase [Palleronia sp. LCG004]
MAEIDPVELTAELIRCPSVTPVEGGAIDLLHRLLDDAGFVCTRIDQGGIANLHAIWDRGGKILGFNGHTDVVPVGDPAAWTHDPFGAEMSDGLVYGRGACDMKSGVAAFVAAAIEHAGAGRPGSIAIAITGDEEGDGIHGTPAILDWMDRTGARMDACIVGEPTCPETMGEMIKVGRRGSMTVWLTATGRQGHSAYPQNARNPIHAMVALLDRLIAFDLPDASDLFDPTSVQVTGFDTGNAANNVIPGQCRAMANIRFNDAHRSSDLSEWIADEIAAVTRATDVEFSTETKVSGESFVTEEGDFSRLIARAVEAETGISPILSTSGGTSDARHIRAHCPVVEVGLVGRTMHQVDEYASIDDIRTLKAIYSRILDAYAR